MRLSMDRRKLLVASLLITARPSQAQSLWDWLSNPDAAARIHAILCQHLSLSSDHAILVPDFIKRLKTEGLHTENPQQLRDWLLDKGQEQQLAAYVVEEFVIASNYFAVAAGQDSQLRILNV
jgi:hypothetical protein